jgi:hypothetical protein
MAKKKISSTSLEVEIDVTKADRFLSEVMEDLPQGGFFDKVVCGSGGTHLALTNSIPYVIVVPFVEIIRSKISQEKYNHVYIVCGEASLTSRNKLQNLKIAIKSGTVKKFLVTYASFERLVLALGDKAKDFQLLVDEAHMLTAADDKNYMYVHIRKILIHYTKFKSFCFMTSTPYDRECIPEELNHLPMYRAKWKPLIPVSLIAQQIKQNFNNYIASIALEHLEGKRPGSAFFFFNSIEEIGAVVKKLLNVCNVNQIRIIASRKLFEDPSPVDTTPFGRKKKEERLAHEVYLQRYVHSDLRIESTSDCKDSPKKLNFLTATAFEGCDIYQSDGVSYVCADGKKRSTRLEIHCQIPQIINRIRDSKYKDRAYLFYAEPFTKNCNTKDSFLKKTEKEIKEAEKLLKDMNKISPRIKEIINKKRLDTHEFLLLEDGKYIINKNARKRALSQWNALNHIYYVTGENGSHPESITNVKPKYSLLEVFHNPEIIIDLNTKTVLDKMRLGVKRIARIKTFREYLINLQQLHLSEKNYMEDLIPMFRNLNESFALEGLKKLEEKYKCNGTRLFEKLQRGKAIVEERESIQSELNLEEGKFYSIEIIKNMLKEVYTKYNLHIGKRKTILSKEIEHFYKIERKTINKIRGCYIRETIKKGTPYKDL